MIKVTFETGFLSLLLHPAVRHVPNDPITGLPTSNPAERIEHLIETLQQENAQIIIPTPALAEFLVRSLDAGPAYLTELKRNVIFDVKDFDQKAAIECAMLEDRARAGGNKRGTSTEPWQKVKIDRQIVAIAISNGASRVYTDDKGILSLCADLKFPTVRISECPLRPVPPQMTFDDFNPASSSSEPEPL